MTHTKPVLAATLALAGAALWRSLDRAQESRRRCDQLIAVHRAHRALRDSEPRLGRRDIAARIKVGDYVIVWAHESDSTTATFLATGDLWRRGTVQAIEDDGTNSWMPLAITFDTGRTVYTQRYAISYLVEPPASADVALTNAEAKALVTGARRG